MATVKEDAMDAATREFRRNYRDTILPRLYSGYLHFFFTSSVCLGGIAFCVASLRSVHPRQLLIVPITFLLGNLVEYWGHRGPMHIPFRGVFIIFERHTLQHHQFFPHREMTFENSRDFHMVLFPPILIVAFLGGVATPVGLLVRHCFDANTAFLYVATALGYFLNYEWFHFAYHMRPDSWMGRLPGMRQLRRHHTLHHNRALMTRYHFNITYPICDWIFDTLCESPLSSPAPAPRQGSDTPAP